MKLGLLFSLKRWLYTKRPEWFQPRSICSRCKVETRRGGWLSERKLSHGLCSACVSHFRSVYLAEKQISA